MRKVDAGDGSFPSVNTCVHYLKVSTSDLSATTSAESWTRSLDSKVKASSLQMKGLLREPSEWLDGWTKKGCFASKERAIDNYPFRI